MLSRLWQLGKYFLNVRAVFQRIIRQEYQLRHLSHAYTRRDSLLEVAGSGSHSLYSLCSPALAAKARNVHLAVGKIACQLHMGDCHEILRNSRVLHTAHCGGKLPLYILGKSFKIEISHRTLQFNSECAILNRTFRITN